jgi:S1-C subfamily serine protease
MWFVRMRGRVIGPLQVQQLKSLRDRGQFRSFHEISEDRQAWRPASTLTEVFAAAAAENQEVQEAYALAEARPHPPEAEPQQSSASWYYVAANGKRQGPVSEHQLIDLWSTGAITAMTLVWKEGLQNWLAISAPELGMAPPIRSVVRRPRRRPRVLAATLAACGFACLAGLVAFIVFGYMYWWNDRPTPARKGLAATAISPNSQADHAEPRPVPRQPDRQIAAGAASNVLQSSLAAVGHDKDLADAIGLVVCGYQLTEPDGTQEDVCLSHGSSFAVSPDGFFLTNKHVVEHVWKLMHAEPLLEKARKEHLLVIKPSIWIFLKGNKFVANLVHVSDNYDFAILKIAHRGHCFRLGGVDEVQRGVKIAACGFPAVAMKPLSPEEFIKDKVRKLNATKVEQIFKPRDFEFVMTTGTVSRVIPDEERHDRWIQHNATVNHGNSGGPLILEGDSTVLGINTLRVADEAFFSLGITQLREEIDKFVPKVTWK